MILVKPDRIIKMMAYILFCMTISCYVIVLFPYNPIVELVINTGFSFIFPTFIFISFWYIQLKRKRENLSLPRFYLDVCLNAILPYLICLIPYMIYESNTNFLDAIIPGNNMPQFIYFRTMIELNIIYPLIEYMIKKKVKFVLITLMAFTIIFNLFNLSAYLITDVFEYIIFAAIGISFAEYERKANRFLRKNKYKIRYSFLEGIVLVYFTALFEDYGFLNPASTTFYSLATMLGICYICYKIKAFQHELRVYWRGAILDFFTHNPLIISSAVALLHPIIIKILYQFLANLSLSNCVVNGIIFLIAIICFIVLKKITDVYYIKHKKELYLERERW